MKKVSVIIPVYNVEKYIAATIQSVLSQTYPNFELLIIDDSSPDNSIKICQQFTDSRIKIIHQNNRGLAGARNAGIRNAQGEYIAFLDGDDLWLPEKLEKHIQHLESSPLIGVSFSQSAFIDEGGKPLGIYQVPRKLQNITAPYMLCRNPIGNGSAPVIRREVLEEIKFQDNLQGYPEDFYFDEHFRRSEDIECWIRIAIRTSWKIEGIPEALTLYRVNTQGLSANWQEQLESWEKVIDKTRLYAPEIIHQWENPARAYQLRYLARRAVSQGSALMAVELIHKALGTSWLILVEEPRRTLMTWAASYLLFLLPDSFFNQLQYLAMKITGFTQKKRFIKSSLGNKYKSA
ncbi:glycosyl transferase family 2 [Gloeothece citriformis PCC 7424]|uniref:Glycosyl transferase family 2 n=1 Tax=Gloeothece citriformis (strain PCC 7424) TaxID=65393 RepID=B7KAG7_GLOC7|nr:glycosyltransferase family 2 protein [Gloeothece citriformis]ACK72941.1 glycosyl transferase family 2 [Gloeothece citriformis PCC 7424]